MVHALALAAVLAAGPAREGNDARPGKEVPIAVQVARELLTPGLWDRMLNGIVAQYAAQFRAMAEKNGGTADAGLEAAMRRLYDDSIPYGEVIDLQASLFQKYFTDAELVQLRDFYRSPLGMKMRDRMPEIQQDAIALTLEKVDMQRIGEALRPHFHMPSNGEGSAAEPPKSGPPSAPEPGASQKANPGR